MKITRNQLSGTRLQRIISLKITKGQTDLTTNNTPFARQSTQANSRISILSKVKNWFATKYQYVFYDRSLQLLLQDWEYEIETPVNERCKFCKS